MPDLVRIKQSSLPYVVRMALHLFDLAAYEVLYRFSPVRNKKFFNGGYLPLANDMLPCTDCPGEEASAMMYHLLLRCMVDDLDLQPQRILDVGCGQGGGLDYAHKVFVQASLSGTDRNATAVRLARRNLAHVPGCEFAGAKGETIAFGDAKFDFVLSVGAPTYFGLTTFVAEAARVCEAGGTIALSGGYRQGDHVAIERELRDAADRCGLKFIRYANITPNTFAALQADIPRRMDELRRVPWPFRAYGWKWADMPGSAEYEEYATGKRADFAAVLVKP